MRRHMGALSVAALLLTACGDPHPPSPEVDANVRGNLTEPETGAVEEVDAEPLARVVLETERGYEFAFEVLEFEPWAEAGDPGFSMVRLRGSGSIENLTDREAPPTGFTISASFDLSDAPFAAGTNALGAPLLTSECPSAILRRTIDTVRYCNAAGMGVWRPQTLGAQQQIAVTWNRADPVFHVRDEDVSRALDMLSAPVFIHVAAFEEGSIDGVEVTQQVGELTRQTEVLAEVAGRMESLDMGFRSRDYSFVAQAGDEIVIENRIGPHNASVYLYDPDGEEIAEVRSVQGRLSQSDPITLPKTGTYVFAIGGFPNSGYEVRVTRRS